MSVKKLMVLVVSFCLIIICASLASADVAGDVTGDGVVLAEDARYTLRLAVGLDDSLTELQIDKADIDLSGRIEASDARLILRTSVGLEKEKHYFNRDVITEPTCTTGGQYLRTCSVEGCKESAFVQDVPELGHSYKNKVVVTEMNCTTNGIIHYNCTRCSEYREEIVKSIHKWKDATCTAPKTCSVCKQTEGKALGHTTRIGYCDTCKKYIKELKTEADSIISNLNEGVRNLNSAYDDFNIAVESGFSNTLDKYGKQSKKKFGEAYNSFVYAYNACGSYEEFSAAKPIIKSILDTVYEIYSTPDLTSKNYTKVIKTVDADIEKVNTLKVALKTEVNKWKE